MTNEQLNKIAIKVIELLANENLPIGYLQEIFNRVSAIIDRETIIKKIDS